MQRHYIKLRFNEDKIVSFIGHMYNSFHTFLNKRNTLFNSVGKYTFLRFKENKNDQLCMNFFFEKLKNVGIKKEFSTRKQTYDLGNLENFNISVDNKIYVKENLYDIIDSLCKNKEVESISANIIFFVLKFLNTKNIATSEEYKNNIKRIYFDLIKCYHKIFKNINENGEFIFCIFNDDTIKSTSPALKKNKKNSIQEIVLNSIEFYFKNNKNNKNKLNINLICDVVKYKKFLLVLNSINYDKYQLIEKLNVKSIDYLFYQFLNDKTYISKAIELASLFYSETWNITKPFKKGSCFNCLVLLKNILKIQSKNSLFLFFNSLKHDHLKKEVFLFLLSVDPLTGFLSNYWGYLATKEYLLLDNSKKTENEYIEQIKNNDILKERYIDNNDNLDNEYYNLPDNMKNILLLNSIDEFKKLMLSIKNEQEEHWEKNIYNNEDTYNIETVDKIIELQDINDHLKKKNKRYYVAIDVEWNKDQKASVISISTNKQIYVVDILNIDYNYKLLMYSFFKWLLENPFIHKLFYNFASDMQIISLFFENISSLNTFTNVIDLKDPLYVDIEDKDSNYENNIFYFETLNRNIINKNDIELFKKLTNSNLYDINRQIKNGLYNLENITPYHTKINKLHFKSLNDLCQNFLKKKLNKQLQVCNWNIRPLTKEQINYVAIDSYNLIKIEEKIVENNYISSCLSNSSQLYDIFLQKYKLKNFVWE